MLAGPLDNASGIKIVVESERVGWLVGVVVDIRENCIQETTSCLDPFGLCVGVHLRGLICSRFILTELNSV